VFPDPAKTRPHRPWLLQDRTCVDIGTSKFIPEQAGELSYLLKEAIVIIVAQGIASDASPRPRHPASLHNSLEIVFSDGHHRAGTLKHPSRIRPSLGIASKPGHLAVVSFREPPP
jgi:hypothetical protein